MSRAIIIALRAARSVVTTLIAPPAGGVTFHILTEAGVVIDTEAANQLRTE